MAVFVGQPKYVIPVWVFEIKVFDSMLSMPEGYDTSMDGHTNYLDNAYLLV